LLAGWSDAVAAWEGHDWNQWRQVTTWQKPDLRTDQAGRADLAPVLGGTVAGLEPIVSIAGWEERRNLLSTTVRSVLGSPSNLQKPPLEVRELGLDALDGYTRRHLLIRSEPDDWIPAYLLVPTRRPTARAPAMICLHQTVARGKQEPCGIKGNPELAFAVELVQRGFVCIAPDVIGFGERIPAGRQPYHDSLAFYRKHPGWSFMGKMIWDVARVIDYLETLPFVDAKRIGSIGHSHGAYGTLFATAFQPRIAAAIASCGFTTFRADPKPERWSHLTGLIPQLGFYLPEVASIPFDWQHVLALAAPRPLFIWYATKDTVFPRTENLDGLLRDVQSVYRLYQADDALAWRAFDGQHTFPKEGREQAYRWLEGRFAAVAERPASVEPASGPPADQPPRLKTRSAFFPDELVARARANAKQHAWAAAIRDPLVSAAQPWLELSDEHLWSLMFGPSIRRAWQVWSDGHCPACRKPVPMYEWIPDALRQPWKMRCPHCRELFPKNDFAKFYRSALTEQALFDPARADRSLLFNVEHPDPTDPLHGFGVDDGEGYVEGGRRWRFIGAYLIFGQWKQAIVDGLRKLAAAYLVTGDRRYAHKAGVLLDRVADVYPTFDFGKEGVMYEGAPRAGYVSTWHDACVEVLDLALAYDAVFDGLARDPDLTGFLAAKAAQHGLANRKASFADIQRNIEERIFRDTLAHRPKIESNYPSTDVTIATLHTVLGWPENRADVMAQLDAIITTATAVEGMTGEKGIAGYTVIAPQTIALLLGRYARADPAFLRETLRRHPRLHAMYRFHIDTQCLGQYYPRTGDTGSFAERTPGYPALPFTSNPGLEPSSYAFLWELYEATGDVDFVRVLYAANGGSPAGLPYDLFAVDPAAFQTAVARVIAERGSKIPLRSVNKTEWGLAILRSGDGPDARAAWLDYDSGERHGHADAMTIGLFAKGLDLLPDFGYPPVQYGGWSSPRAVWYTQTAAHNTVAVDGKNSVKGTGRTTLWFDGKAFRAVRASGAEMIKGRQFERTLALVDISERDSYLLDVCRVAGGHEHSRFFHGHFGPMSATGLSPQAATETRFGEVMRNFRRDPAPRAGWSVDWIVEDRLNYSPAGRETRLRLMDLTDAVEVDLAESWVAVGMFGGTADAWIPSVITRRRSTGEPLRSAFVAVLEPYERNSNIAAIRRLKLQDNDGQPCADGFVGVEVQLADGRRDVFLCADVEASPETRTMVEKQRAISFTGDLCLVRFDQRNALERVVFCRGQSLRVADALVRSRDAPASFELDLRRDADPIVAGPADAVELVEVAGARRWPAP
jgi:dienelactone hydrolase